MVYLISYDITKDSLRQRIGDKLIATGLDRIQYSVYIGGLPKTAFQDLVTWLNQEILKGDPNKDSIIIIQLTNLQFQEMMVIGKEALDKPEISGEKSTFIW